VMQRIEVAYIQRDGGSPSDDLTIFFDINTARVKNEQNTLLGYGTVSYIVTDGTG